MAHKRYLMFHCTECSPVPAEKGCDYCGGGSWLLKIYEDWDTMTEEQRHDYIWEAAMDNGKVSFTYEDSGGTAK